MPTGLMPKTGSSLYLKIILGLGALTLTPLIALEVSRILFINQPSLLLTSFIVISSITLVLVIHLAIKIAHTLTEVDNGLVNITKGNLTYKIKNTSGFGFQQLAKDYNLLGNYLINQLTVFTSQQSNTIYQRDFLNNIISNLSDIVVVLNINHQVIFINSQSERLLGLNISTAYGQSIGQLLKVVSANEPLLPSEYCPESVINNSTQFIRKGVKLISHKEAYADLLSQPIKLTGQNSIGYLIVFHDISEEKHFEEMKLDFVSMAAHELRTPLTAIKGYLYVFLRDYGPYLNQEQITFLTRVNIASQRLVNLVENLLNVTRIEKKALTIHLEIVDWVENINLIISDLQDQAKDKHQDLSFILPAMSIPKLNIDKFRMSEVLTNLITNAINYTPIGGKIIVSVEKNDKEVITHISDTGEGIPPAALPHLFNKFFRVSGVLEQGSKGTGLGLYITKTIVNMHNGNIWVKSELGKGSIFSFSIPIIAKP